MAELSAAAAVTVTIDDPREAAGVEDYDEDAFSGLGFRGELRGVTKISATIRADGVECGRVKLTLVDRDFNNFHAACDAESTALQLTGFSFFARDGRTPRVRAVKALGREVREGCFAYLDSFRIDECAVQDPESEIATAALRQLLQRGPLVGAWNFCVYIPEAEPHLTAAESALETPSSVDAWNVVPSAATDRGLRRDCTPFLRCGFAQADELLSRRNPPFLFAAPSTLLPQPLSHAAASALELVRLVPVPLSDADLELRTFCAQQFQRQLYGPGGLPEGACDFEQRLAGFIARGASVRRACALHCAVALGNLDHLELLCALGGPDAINLRDPSNGYTPLMIAASAILGRAAPTVPPSTAVIVKLLVMGADKSAVDDQGRTALGHFWASDRGLRDFRDCFRVNTGGTLYQYDMEAVKALIQQLLTPPNGPTDADTFGRDEADADQDQDEA